jgi:hypothetical protein
MTEMKLQVLAALHEPARGEGIARTVPLTGELEGEPGRRKNLAQDHGAGSHDTYRPGYIRHSSISITMAPGGRRQPLMPRSGLLGHFALPEACWKVR